MSDQPFADLPPLSPARLHARREGVFLVMAGLFIGTLAMLNILGISRFIPLASFGGDAGWQWGDWGKVSFAVAVGVLPYPLTFLCTDLISEFYGRKRANQVVMVGLLVNLWVVAVLWFGGVLPTGPTVDPFPGVYQQDNATLTLKRGDVHGQYVGELVMKSDDAGGEPWSIDAWAGKGHVTGRATREGDDVSIPFSIRKDEATLDLPAGPRVLPLIESAEALETNAYDYAFWRVRVLTFGAVFASMIAYLAAQLCDVYLFHFWKRLTRGRHLWLRNNGSTMVSQFVDTFAVITITHFYAHALPIKDPSAPWPELWTFIATGYVFKFAAALIDTPIIYLCVGPLSRFLRIDPITEHDADREESS